MASILESLQNKAKGTLFSGTSQEAPSGGEAQQAAVQAAEAAAPKESYQDVIQKAMQASTGQVEAPQISGARISAAGEQAAAATAKVKQQQVFKSLEQEEKGQALEEAHAFLQLSDEQMAIKEQALNIRQKMVIQTNQILQEFQQAGEKLDIEKNKAKVEQLGFMMRLQNDKYIAKLQDEAARAGLEDDYQFQSSCYDSQFENQIALLNSDLEFKSMINADDREFSKRMASMDIDLAWSILQSEMQASATAAKYQSVGTGIQAVIKGVQTYATSSSTENTGNDLANTVDTSYTPQDTGYSPASSRPTINK